MSIDTIFSLELKRHFLQFSRVPCFTMGVLDGGKEGWGNRGFMTFFSRSIFGAKMENMGSTWLRRTVTLSKDSFTTGLQLMLPSSMFGSHDSISSGIFFVFLFPLRFFLPYPL